MMIQLALFLITLVNSSPLILNEDNFESTIKDNELIFVKFFAPWCGYCKSMAPHFEQLSKSALEFGVTLAEVDCTEEQDICKKYEIKGYPTLFLFKEGKIIQYSGERTEPEMLNFLKKKAGKYLTLVESLKSLKNIMSDSFIIGHFPNPESDEFQEFKNSSKSETVSFYYVTDSSLLHHLTDSPSNVLFYRNMDNKTISYKDQTINYKAIDKFISFNMLPGVIWLTRENMGKVFTGNSKILIVMINSTSDSTADLDKLLLNAFESVNGKVRTCIADVNKPEFDTLSEFLGFTQFPAFGGLKLGDQFLRYHPKEFTLSQENLNDFISKFASGKAERFIKKEPVPEDWNELPVKVVTYNNFESVVLDETKHVFIMIYASWCTHCKTLKPIWEQLAIHYEDNSDLVIAKTDGTKNEYDLNIEGFPTLYFYPQGAKTYKSYVAYNGKKTLKDLIHYVDSKMPSTDLESSEEL